MVELYSFMTMFLVLAKPLSPKYIVQSLVYLTTDGASKFLISKELNCAKWQLTFKIKKGTENVVPDQTLI